MLIVLRVAAGHSRPDTAWSTYPDPSIHKLPPETSTGIVSAIRFGTTGVTSTDYGTSTYANDSERTGSRVVHIAAEPKIHHETYESNTNFGNHV
jgi:hypothetical protein